MTVNRPNLTVLAQEGPAELEIVLDPEGRVQQLLGRGLQPEEESVFPSLARELQGLPLREASEHGALRLVFRQPERSVAGVLQVANSHLPLNRIERLLRRAYEAYRADAVPEATPEPERLTDSPWHRQSPRAQRETVEASSERVSQSLGFPSPAVRPVSTTGEYRVVVEVDHDLPVESQGALLLALERDLRQTVEPRLEVFAQPAKDRNKVRNRE